MARRSVIHCRASAGGAQAPRRLAARIAVPAVALVLTVAFAPSLHAQTTAKSETPAGQITFAVTVTLAPTWFDPPETPGVITPVLFPYALHHALLNPMPGDPG